MIVILDSVGRWQDWVGTTMTGGDNSWLSMDPARAGRGTVLARAGRRVHVGLRLADLVRGRPPGLTGHQWNTASRSLLDLVVCPEETGRPEFAVEFRSPAPDASARRAERVVAAVTAAVGLPVLRIVSATLRAAEHGPAIVSYVIDARRYAEGAAGSDVAAIGFRDIVGRLPDGRTGAVNDLGALARAEAVEAYVARRLADPILRGLHVSWVNGPAEGWSWVDVRPGECLVERVSVQADRLTFGVDPARFAEDLAAFAIGDRIRSSDLGGASALVRREELLDAVRQLRQRRDELVDDFAYDHLCEA
ncbi:hypothetical protein GCM10011608_25560 [Micromonospora sonchi]|uniref:DUF2726 domain-containing protein n=1 Tax=Micromonospora sonchi TaxID=1763543 RepID=A0A917TV08_9ACTN|nr:DUF2726 domain-containing protein [Micromonospora sonchi]GGM39680.1 hypothetical protein GCM10011608_25560 [Micromonospora sonchi]